MSDAALQIEGYPAHAQCGGVLVPTRRTRQLWCQACKLWVTVSTQDFDLAAGAERRAEQAALAGKEIVRVAGRLQKPKPAQATLFSGSLLEGGPVSSRSSG